MMKLLDLFSGIGGFSLGLERTGYFKTVAFCDIEEYPRRVLKKHWPEVPIYDDVRTLSARRLAEDGIEVDAICGGFPCQDISLAGKGAGIDGERSGLWSEYARLIGEIRPRYAIMENVSALLGRGLGRVLGDLAALGYDAEWNCISSCSIGFPHMRDRVWIVAYAASERREQCRRIKLTESSHITRNIYQRFSEPEPSRVVNGIPHRMDRINGLGNAVVPQIPELIGNAIKQFDLCASADA